MPRSVRGPRADRARLSAAWLRDLNMLSCVRPSCVARLSITTRVVWRETRLRPPRLPHRIALEEYGVRENQDREWVELLEETIDAATCALLDPSVDARGVRLRQREHVRAVGLRHMREVVFFDAAAHPHGAEGLNSLAWVPFSSRLYRRPSSSRPRAGRRHRFSPT